MKFLFLLFVGLFISLSASGAVVGNIGGGKDISLSGSDQSSTSFDRSDFTYKLFATLGGTLGIASTFRHASGTAYSTLGAPTKSTLIGLTCECFLDTNVSMRIVLIAGAAERDNSAIAGLDRQFYSNAINANVMSVNPTKLSAAKGHCRASIPLDINLTQAFGALRPFFSLHHTDAGSSGYSCFAYVKEE